MANIKSAKKRIRVIEVKTQRNRRVKAHLKEILKSFETAVAAGDQKAARDALAFAEKKLQQAASKGTIHKNSASRKVSRITARFVQVFGQDALLEKAERPKPRVKAEPVAKTPETVAAEKKSVKKSTKKEAAEEAIAETAVEEVTEAVAEETAVEETATEEVAEAVAEEAVEEVAETPAEVAEITEEAVAETTEEVTEAVAEETLAEEAAVEETVAEEVAETPEEEA